MTTLSITTQSMERRLRIAGIFVLVGLLVEMFALRWVHPAAFLVLAFIGIPIASLGILIYLYSLVSLRNVADGTGGQAQAKGSRGED